jgi:RimJ/RimL family protein N-acetyltransferase
MDADAPARTTLDAAWPLYALRIRSERLMLRLPTDAEILTMIDLAKAGIHDPAEMPFGVPWSTVPSPAFERGFLAHHWLMRATWSPDDWTLNLMTELDGVPIGTQGIGAVKFATFGTVNTGSWLGRAYQGHGYGKEMRGAILAFAFDGLGAKVARTEAFLDNAPSNAVSRSLGYVEDGLNSIAPEGVARDSQRFRMTAEMWRARPRPPIEVEGLDACRDMFGIPDPA